MERQLLIDSLNSLSNCSEQTKIKFAEIFSIKTLNNGQSLFTGSKNCRSFYFIIKGLLQSNCTSQNKVLLKGHKNQNSTIQLHLPGDTILYDEGYQVSALTHSIILSTEYQQVHQLCSTDPSAISIMMHFQECWNKKLISQLHLLHLELGIYRYQYALSQLGPYFYQVPHHILASYLSMSRKHLYRINKQSLKIK